jgi:hypothetical protein
MPTNQSRDNRWPAALSVGWTAQAWTSWQVSGRSRGPETIPDGVQDICLFLVSGFAPAAAIAGGERNG